MPCWMQPHKDSVIESKINSQFTDSKFFFLQTVVYIFQTNNLIDFVHKTNFGMRKER